VSDETIALVPRGGNAAGLTTRISFRPTPERGATAPTGQIGRISAEHNRTIAELTLERPLITELVTDGRERRRSVPFDQIPRQMKLAVLAIEDRRFYDHPGVDIIRTIAAVVTNLRGDRPYLVGGSTLTQQLVKNFFLTPEKSIRRKLLEQFMALVVERKLTKDQILALYLNEVYLGQRGSFAIHGVAEGARLMFAKDVRNLNLNEAATIAGVIQAPQVHSPFRSLERAKARRNVVLEAMRAAEFIPEDTATRVSREPVVVADRAIDSEAPYFVDYVSKGIADAYPQLVSGNAVEVHTTLDLRLQRLAEAAIREGMSHVDQLLAKKGSPRAEAALIALDPATGDILAFVGGRSYSQSQFNRALNARRQPGSVFKPFVYLAAFERTGADPGPLLTPATIVSDEPTAFTFDHQEYRPTNYDGTYAGPITLRRALAQSRNIPTIKVAQAAGYSRIADLWKRVGTGAPPKPYPSIALGVFEATPLEIATAYTVFPNLGEVHPARWVDRIVSPEHETIPLPASAPHRVVAPEVAYVVLDMMRGVMNEGTGSGARAAGFALDAAGKSGTTNDLRDAWFVGFTPELLAVVWVGLDDNSPVELTGSQAALPIWTSFMSRALSGHRSVPFRAPAGVTFADVDPDTGALATRRCPRKLREAFLRGSEPLLPCDRHRF
jgi:penicillin-binding protein 1B